MFKRVDGGYNSFSVILNMSENTTSPGWRGVNDDERENATTHSFSHCWVDLGEERSYKFEGSLVF